MLYLLQHPTQYFSEIVAKQGNGLSNMFFILELSQFYQFS